MFIMPSHTNEETKCLVNRSLTENSAIAKENLANKDNLITLSNENSLDDSLYVECINGDKQELILKSKITDRLSLFGKQSNRIDWDVYFLRIALNVATRSTCLRRKYGAVIVSQDHRIISTGYNGAASKEPNCSDKRKCYREELGIPHGERYELCVAVHAEANAILKCNRMEMLGSTIYIVGIDADNKLYGKPCDMCKRLIKNSGIKNVVYLSEINPKKC